MVGFAYFGGLQILLGLVRLENWLGCAGARLGWRFGWGLRIGWTGLEFWLGLSIWLEGRFGCVW